MIKFDVLFFKSQKLLEKHQIWIFGKSAFKTKSSTFNLM